MRVAVLGGGPVALELAVGAVRAGLSVSILEQGPSVASNILSWGHVRLFSPNSMNCSSQGLAVLEELGVPPPDPSLYPTGKQYVTDYLAPLARWLTASPACQVRLQCRVVSVGREGRHKGQFDRQGRGFRVLLDTQDGEEWVSGFEAVVDCTGTYPRGCWVGVDGVPALGERSLGTRIERGLPDIGGAGRPQYSGRVSLVVGSGASAATSLQQLKGLGDAGVVWVTRNPGLPYTVQKGDTLPQREALYTLANLLATQGQEGEAARKGFDSFRHLGGAGVKEIRQQGEQLVVVVEQGEECREVEVVVDNILAQVGYKPDTSLTQELQVHYCYATEGPMKLAAALMAGGGGCGDCLAQVTPGPATLVSPEPGLLVLGMKSYGRGSAFLLRVGHEQVEHAVSLLTALEDKVAII